MYDDPTAYERYLDYVFMHPWLHWCQIQFVVLSVWVFSH